MRIARSPRKALTTGQRKAINHEEHEEHEDELRCGFQSRDGLCYLPVNDGRCFYDGFGIRGEQGDLIAIGKGDNLARIERVEFRFVNQRPYCCPRRDLGNLGGHASARSPTSEDATQRIKNNRDHQTPSH